MRLNQITIACVDYAESVAFYRALGLARGAAHRPARAVASSLRDR